MTKEEKIEKLIRDFNDYELLTIFFDISKLLIEKTGLSSDDKRLSLNVRYDSRKRFSFNISSRLVLGMQIENSEILMIFMVNEFDLNEIENYYRVEQFYGKDDFLVYLTIEQFDSQSDPVLEGWLRTCLEYLPKEKGSRFKKSHVPLLYEMSVNKKVREKYFKSAFKNILNLKQESEDNQIDNADKTESIDNTVIEEPEIEGLEGSTREELVKHLKKERDTNFVRKYRKKFKHIVSCPACSFNSKDKYGIADPNSTLEIHHIVPLKHKEGEYIITEKDVSFLCPNCHRTIHRMMADEEKKTISLMEFKKRIK